MSTPLAPIVTAAAKRLSYRESLVAPTVTVIARRHSQGQSTVQIVGWLRMVFVHDAPMAQPDFVTFITDQL
jgi:hypothetical protein